MTDDGTLPVPIDQGNCRVSTLDQLAEMIPEEEIASRKRLRSADSGSARHSDGRRASRGWPNPLHRFDGGV